MLHVYSHTGRIRWHHAAHSPFGSDNVSFKTYVAFGRLYDIKSGTDIIVGITSVVVVGIAIVVAIAEISRRS